jgi:hypothetical protein
MDDKLLTGWAILPLSTKETDVYFYLTEPFYIHLCPRLKQRSTIVQGYAVIFQK